MEQVSFLSELSYPFLSLSQFPTFYPLRFQSRARSPRVPLTWSFFVSITFCGPLSPFHHNTFFIYVISWSSLSFSGSHQESLEGCGSATHPTAASLLYNSIDSDFIPSIVLVVVSLRLFHLCQSVPCFDYSFYKMWILSLGDNTTLLSVCELNNRCALTSHWPWKKWYGHWSWSTSTYRVIRGLKSVAKLILYAIIRS